MLAARGLTVQEVRTRLSRRGFAQGEIALAVERLLARGYLDDRTLAYNVASARVKRLYGRARVAADLGRRGVPARLIPEAVARAFSEVDEDDLASQAAARELGSRSRRLGDRRGVRAAHALVRRGFSRGAALRALRAALGDTVSAEDATDDDAD